MIVNKIDDYLRNVLCAGNLSVTKETLEKHDALRNEVQILSGWIFNRQFLTPEEPVEKGSIRLSACGKCPRQLAYTYHGFPKAGREIDKRAKVVFFMGDMSELLLIALARLAGCEIQNYGLSQLEVSLNIGDKTVKGHPDGFLKDGKIYLLECKSMSSYAYERFEKGEIDESYRYQINAYLEATNLDACCLLALNKDSGVTAELIVNKDLAVVILLKRNLKLVLESTPHNLPAPQFRVDEKGFWPWPCNYCAYWRTCHPNAETVVVRNSKKLKEKGAK